MNPCAYLHNYVPDNVIANPFYAEYLEKAPVFTKHDAAKLVFIQTFIKAEDKNGLIYKIENGRIRPSKHFADSLVGLIKGNKEFTLIDEQKAVYEKALSMAMAPRSEGKGVLIVEGGPGTGKTVVAVNLLVELTNRKQFVQYVSKNAAVRRVYAQARRNFEPVDC